MTITVPLQQLVNLENETTAVTLINNNSDDITTGFDSALNTAGDQMEGNLDMNSFQILNLPAPVTTSSPLRLSDLNSFVGGGTVSSLPSGGTTGEVLTKVNNTDYDVEWAAAIGTGTVTSVGLSLPPDLTVTGSPVTGSGTLTATWATTPTGTGAVVRENSPTLIAPALGTPASGTLTNTTGLPATGLTGTLQAAQFPALTGAVTTTAGSLATSFGTNAVSNANLATAANNTIKSNISGITSSPNDNTISAVLDAQFGNTQGNIVYRGASTWNALAPGTNGEFLLSGGSSANPSWGAGGAGTGTVVSVVGGNQTITAAGTIQTDSGLGLQNISLAASVGSNILTINVVNSAGSTCTSTNSGMIQFRNSTAGTGTVTNLYVTSSLSISTFATGATLGSSNTTPFRFWVVAFNSSGTIILGLINCSTAGRIYPLNEGTVVSSTGMTGSATSAGVFYTPNGLTVSNVPFRILGYVEYSSGLTTAGSYASAPTLVQLYGIGIKKPGDIIQTVSNFTFTQTAATTSTPQNGLTVSITPTSAINQIKIESNVAGGAVSGAQLLVKINRNSTLFQELFLESNGSSFCYNSLSGFYLDQPATSSAVSYNHVFYNFNGGTGTAYYALSNYAGIYAEEIQG